MALFMGEVFELKCPRFLDSLDSYRNFMVEQIGFIERHEWLGKDFC